MSPFEIRWANMPAPIGPRPVLLLSRGPAYQYLAKCIVAEITTTIRGIPQEVPLAAGEGLGQSSVANLDNVHVVATHRLGRLIGVLAVSRRREVKRALGYALDWTELQVL